MTKEELIKQLEELKDGTEIYIFIDDTYGTYYKEFNIEVFDNNDGTASIQ